MPWSTILALKCTLRIDKTALSAVLAQLVLMHAVLELPDWAVDAVVEMHALARATPLVAALLGAGQAVLVLGTSVAGYRTLAHLKRVRRARSTCAGSDRCVRMEAPRRTVLAGVVVRELARTASQRLTCTTAESKLKGFARCAMSHLGSQTYARRGVSRAVLTLVERCANGAV